MNLPGPEGTEELRGLLATALRLLDMFVGGLFP